MSRRTIPTHLSPAARSWLRQIFKAADLEPDQRRVAILAAEALDRGDLARKAVAEHGLVFVDASGTPRARPEVGIERAAKRDFAKLASELPL